MKDCFCDKQQGSVANAIKSALVKYQAVKKEGFNSEEGRDYSQRNRRGYFTEMPMLQKT
jgi:biopolymer transport protein ExbB